MARPVAQIAGLPIAKIVIKYLIPAVENRGVPILLHVAPAQLDGRVL